MGTSIYSSKSMIIKTIVLNDDGGVVSQKEANNWESAEENFGKLQRLIQLTKDEDMEAQAEEMERDEKLPPEEHFRRRIK